MNSKTVTRLPQAPEVVPNRNDAVNGMVLVGSPTVYFYPACMKASSIVNRPLAHGLCNLSVKVPTICANVANEKAVT